MLRDLLNPYFWIITARNRLYDLKVLPSERLSIPVISVGNLSAGGTGKTSLVRYLTQNLSRHRHVGILLRGYKRKSKGFKIILERGNLISTLNEAGDEAYMLSYLHQGNEKVSLAVGEDRVLAGKKMIKELGIELLLLDDGFQHRRLQRDIDLVLLKKKDLEDDLLPIGKLREPLSSLKRASAIILSYQEILPFEFSFRDKPIFKLYRLNFRLLDATFSPLSRHDKTSFIAFCGLGDNEQFYRTLKKLHLSVKKFLSFPDHHAYKNFSLDPSEKYLTTLKDFIKLPQAPNLYFLDFEIEVPGLLEFMDSTLGLNS